MELLLKFLCFFCSTFLVLHLSSSSSVAAQLSPATARSVAAQLSPATALGVTYSLPVDYSSFWELPPLPPEEIVTAIAELQLTAVHIRNPNPIVVRAFQSTEISLLLSIGNHLLKSMANDQDKVADWIYWNIVPFYGSAKVDFISVGDEVPRESDLLTVVPQVMRTVHRALAELSFEGVSVTASLSFDSLVNKPMPPPSARLRYGTEAVVDFVYDFGYPLLVTLCPYCWMEGNRPAFIAAGTLHLYNGTGVVYSDLFHFMVNAVVSSLRNGRRSHIPLLVASAGPQAVGAEPDQCPAVPDYAESYLRSLMAEGSPGAKIFYVAELIDGANHRLGILDSDLRAKFSLFPQRATATGPVDGPAATEPSVVGRIWAFYDQIKEPLLKVKTSVDRVVAIFKWLKWSWVAAKWSWGVVRTWMAIGIRRVA